MDSTTYENDIPGVIQRRVLDLGKYIGMHK